MRFLQILDDRERLLQHVVAVHQRGQNRIRIQAAVSRFELLAAVAQKMYRRIVVRQILQIQGNAHAIRRRATEIAVKLHFCLSPPSPQLQTTRTLNSPSPSTPPFIVSPFTTAPTPSGVPVKIRSPGCSSNSVDR